MASFSPSWKVASMALGRRPTRAAQRLNGFRSRHPRMMPGEEEGGGGQIIGDEGLQCPEGKHFDLPLSLSLQTNSSKLMNCILLWTCLLLVTVYSLSPLPGTNDSIKTTWGLQILWMFASNAPSIVAHLPPGDVLDVLCRPCAILASLCFSSRPHPPLGVMSVDDKRQATSEGSTLR